MQSSILPSKKGWWCWRLFACLCTDVSNQDNTSALSCHSIPPRWILMMIADFWMLILLGFQLIFGRFFMPSMASSFIHRPWQRTLLPWAWERLRPSRRCTAVILVRELWAKSTRLCWSANVWPFLLNSHAWKTRCGLSTALPVWIYKRAAAGIREMRRWRWGRLVVVWN